MHRYRDHIVSPLAQHPLEDHPKSRIVIRDQRLQGELLHAALPSRLILYRQERGFRLGTGPWNNEPGVR